MKAVILAGGFGSRLSEETAVRPKPMVEIGGKPILWHIMKIYSAHGIDEFVICLGYKGYLIKEYFANYHLHTADVTFDLAKRRHGGPPLRDRAVAGHAGGHRREHDDRRAPARVLPYLGDEDFCFTYGDGVADVDIDALIAFHREQGASATVTAVQPPGRFGALDIDGDRVTPVRGEAARRRRLDQRRLLRALTAVARHLDGRQTVWEEAPLRTLAAKASSRATATTASGRRWTRCATATT
jgi:glucose-1-phosphate cytidylyltransferase